MRLISPIRLKVVVVAVIIAMVTIHAAAEESGETVLPAEYRLELAKSAVDRNYTLYGIAMGATVATGFPGPAMMAVSGDLVVQNAQRYVRILEDVSPDVSFEPVRTYARRHNAGLVTTGLGTMVASAGFLTFGYGYYEADNETLQMTGGIIAGVGAAGILTGLVIDAFAVTRIRNWVRDQHRRPR
ncbi:MAG: hypothetical protein GVY29_08445 [Spirochaetes bacterium]|nr:hypothetical protein [Spirochaetota bacterium]